MTARDAFNGVFLWKKPIPAWTSISRKFRSGPVQLQRLLVTDGERVYVTLGLDQPISVLDAASGKELGRVRGHWLDRGDPPARRHAGGPDRVTRARSRRWSRKGKAGGIDYKTTKLIKAFDAESGKLLWRWPAEGTREIMPRTLAVSGDRVFFQESGDTVCLDLEDGQDAWRTPWANRKRPPTSRKQAAARTARTSKKAKAGSGRSIGWTYATLVAQDGVVLSCDGNTLLALDADIRQATVGLPPPRHRSAAPPRWTSW